MMEKKIEAVVKNVKILPEEIVNQRFEVLTAMRKLAEAMQELSEAWEGVEDQIDDALTEQYPFHKDFNELKRDVLDWNIDVITKLKNL